MTRKFPKIILCFSVLLALINPALAQTNAGKPLTFVVPYTPGGSNDFLARYFGQKIGEKTGQTVLVENKAGAGGSIGTSFVAKSAPDGRTLLLAANTLTISASLPSKLPCEISDFKPVALLATQPLFLVATPDFPANNVSELLALARAKPGQISYGTPGNGTPHHLAGELLKSLTKVDLLHVPFSGASALLNEVIAGRVNVAWSTATTSGAFIASNKLKLIGIASATPLPEYPSAQTFIQAGVANFDVGFWYGIVAPRSVPDSAITSLYEVVSRLAKEPETEKKLVAMGFVPTLESPERFGKRIQEDMVRWKKVVRDAKIQE